MDLQFDSICLPDLLRVHLSSNALKITYCRLLASVQVTKVLTLFGESHHEAETLWAHRRLAKNL